MSKTPVVYCRECRFSEPDKNSPWQLRCHNPEVNRKDSWALSSLELGRGSECSSERGHANSNWFAACGMKGRQYEARGEQ